MGLATEQSQAQYSAVPASAPGHTPRLSCSAQPRPRHPVGFWVPLVAPWGVTPQVPELDSPVTWDSRRGRAGPVAGACPRLGQQVPFLSEATGTGHITPAPHTADLGTSLPPQCPPSTTKGPLAPSNCLLSPQAGKTCPASSTQAIPWHTPAYGRAAYTSDIPLIQPLSRYPSLLELPRTTPAGLGPSVLRWCVCIKAMKQALSSPSSRGRENVRKLAPRVMQLVSNNALCELGRQVAGYTLLNPVPPQLTSSGHGANSHLLLVLSFLWPAGPPFKTGCTGPKAAQAGGDGSDINLHCSSRWAASAQRKASLSISPVKLRVLRDPTESISFRMCTKVAHGLAGARLMHMDPPTPHPTLRPWGLLKQAVPAPPLSCDILRTGVFSLPCPYTEPPPPDPLDLAPILRRVSWA